MTDKVQKIREEVERIQLYTQSEVLKQVLDYIDEVQKEPISEDKMTISKEWFEHCKKSWYNEGYIDGKYNRDRQFEESVSEELEEATNNYVLNVRKCYPRVMDETDRYICNAFKTGAQWQKTKYESTTKDLGEYINELSKQFPEVSFAKLSRIAVRVSKWQKELFEKNRLAACDRQTEEEAEIEQSFVMGIIECEHRQPTFDDAIKYGMRLQKEQMMAKAIDGKVIANGMGNPILHLWDKGRHLIGKKVKVIVIKDE